MRTGTASSPSPARSPQPPTCSASSASPRRRRCARRGSRRRSSLLGPTDPRDLRAALAARTAITLWSGGAYARDVDRAALAAGRPFPVHVKIDTGVTRFGCEPGEAAALFAALESRPASLRGRRCVHAPRRRRGTRIGVHAGSAPPLRGGARAGRRPARPRDPAPRGRLGGGDALSGIPLRSRSGRDRDVRDLALPADPGGRRERASA